MYQPSYYLTATDAEVIAFMQSNPFAIMIGFDGSFPVATQLPLMTMRKKGIIRIIGHFMTKTDHGRSFQQDSNILLLYTGPNAYISAAVYTDPKKASTWNYQSVQVRGKINLLDPDQTRQALKDLTELSEPSLSSPAAFQHMDSVYIDKNLKAITGFEILVRDIRHVYKLSQDHSKENRKSIINDLESRNDQASHYIAQQMKIGLDDHGITNS